MLIFCWWDCLVSGLLSPPQYRSHEILLSGYPPHLEQCPPPPPTHSRCLMKSSFLNTRRESPCVRCLPKGGLNLFCHYILSSDEYWGVCAPKNLQYGLIILPFISSWEPCPVTFRCDQRGFLPSALLGFSPFSDHLQTRGKMAMYTCICLDLSLPACRAGRPWFLLFQPPGRWDFIWWP